MKRRPGCAAVDADHLRREIDPDGLGPKRRQVARDVSRTAPEIADRPTPLRGFGDVPQQCAVEGLAIQFVAKLARVALGEPVVIARGLVALRHTTIQARTGCR